MPKRKRPELAPKEQYERFLEAAKKAEVSDDKKEFERVFKIVAKRKPKQGL